MCIHRYTLKRWVLCGRRPWFGLKDSPWCMKALQRCQRTMSVCICDLQNRPSPPETLRDVCVCGILLFGKVRKCVPVSNHMSQKIWCGMFEFLLKYMTFDWRLCCETLLRSLKLHVRPTGLKWVSLCLRY